MPVHPRGPRRPARPPAELFVAVPRVSPRWELAAVRALMKPQAKDGILHTPARQPWPAAAQRVAARVLAEAGARLSIDLAPVTAAGDYHLLVRVPGTRPVEARAVALALSAAVPNAWVTVDRLFARDGRFFRRERGFKLTLVPATNVHLTREVRGAMRGLL